MTKRQQRIDARKNPLCEIIERLAGRKLACASWLFAGCLLSSTFEAAATTYTVNTTGDPGAAGTLSLRQAWTTAVKSPANVIKFDDSLRDSTITLTQGLLSNGNYSNNVYIQGPGSRHLTIAGNGSQPVIEFATVHPTVLNLSGITIANGHLPAGVPVDGGGCLEVKYSDLKMQDIVITGCTSGQYGGALLVKDGNLAMRNSTITGNSSQMGGGGIQTLSAQGTTHGSVYIYDSTISNNVTYGYGAGIATAGADYFRVTRSLISGNYVMSPADDAAGGGGIALKKVYKQALVLNSTIANNLTYASGGGIGMFDAMSSQVTQLTFATIVGNYSGFGYGGNGVHAAGSFGVSSSIIANNFNRGDNVDIDGTAFVDHSLILNIGSAHVSGQYNIFQSDPHLGALASNDGPTLTMLPAVGSPVIDAGGSPGTVNTDQRGLARPVGAGTDMGAVERQKIEDEIFHGGFDSS